MTSYCPFGVILWMVLKLNWEIQITDEVKKVTPSVGSISVALSSVVFFASAFFCGFSLATRSWGASKEPQHIASWNKALASLSLFIHNRNVWIVWGHKKKHNQLLPEQLWKNRWKRINYEHSFNILIRIQFIKPEHKWHDYIHGRAPAEMTQSHANPSKWIKKERSVKTVSAGGP